MSYPVEVLPGQLYMGHYRQATSLQIHKDLKLSAIVNVSEEMSDMCVRTPLITVIKTNGQAEICILHMIHSFNVFTLFKVRFDTCDCTVLHIPVADSAKADLIGSFERVCMFIGEFHFLGCLQWLI